mmetsp:Transcript_2659/g.3988  ORF Transcript_2659/g.3988 Transcript_2659/m.3988 type:complete len:727 (-) Transcript_2659:229-2409(-)
MNDWSVSLSSGDSDTGVSDTGSSDEVLYPRTYQLRQKQKIDGMDTDKLPMEKKGLAPVTTMHHITRITEGGVVCYRVRICRTCSGLKQLLELGSCADLESALLLNDVHEILEGRVSQLQLLVPDDMKYFNAIQIRKRGSTEDTPVMSVINERQWKNHMKRLVQTAHAMPDDSDKFDTSTLEPKKLRQEVNRNQQSAIPRYGVSVYHEPTVNPMQNFCARVTTANFSAVIALWMCRSWNYGMNAETRTHCTSLIEEFQVALFQICNQDTNVASLHAVGLSRTVAALSVPRATVFSLLASQYAGNDMTQLQHMFRRLNHILPKHDALRIGELRSMAILIGIPVDCSSTTFSSLTSIAKTRAMLCHANMGFFLDSLRRYMAFLDNGVQMCSVDGVVLDRHDADIRIQGYHKQTENCVRLVSQIASLMKPENHNDSCFSIDNRHVNYPDIVMRNLCGLTLCGAIALCGTSGLLWKLQGDQESVVQSVNLSLSNICQSYSCYGEETVNSKCLYSSARLMMSNVANIGSASFYEHDINLVRDVLTVLVGDSTYAVRAILHTRPQLQLSSPVLESGLISRMVANMTDMESYLCACAALMQYISYCIGELIEKEEWETELFSVLDTVLGPQLRTLNGVGMQSIQNSLVTLFDLTAYVCGDMAAEIKRAKCATTFSLTSYALTVTIDATVTISQSLPHHAERLARIYENSYYVLRNVSHRFAFARLLLDSILNYS